MSASERSTVEDGSPPTSPTLGASATVQLKNEVEKKPLLLSLSLILFPGFTYKFPETHLDLIVFVFL